MPGRSHVDAEDVDAEDVDAEPVIDAFFTAILQRDTAILEHLYADDVEVWHNVTGKVMDKAASLALLDFWTASVEDMHYEILERRAFDGGVVQRHVIHGHARDVDLHVDVCIVIHVEHDRITRIFEYLDRDTVAAVFAPTTRPGHR